MKARAWNAPVLATCAMSLGLTITAPPAARAQLPGQGVTAPTPASAPVHVPVVNVPPPSVSPPPGPTAPLVQTVVPIRPANFDAMPPAVAAQGVPAQAAPPTGPLVQRLTLEEARQRALSNSKLLALAALNIKGKELDTKIVRTDYFPQIIGNVVYFHFNQDLGTVLSTPGRHVTGPKGTVFPITTARVIDVPVFNQNSYVGSVMAVQPITALLKIRQGVKIAQADEHIAQAQLEAGARELASGVEQLYWGLLAAQRIRAGALVAVKGAEELARLGTIEARLALQEARQGLNQVENQIADLEAQLNALLDQPVCTKLELVEPPLPVPPVTSCDQAADLAASVSPEVQEAGQNVVKAHAAVCAAKVDYLPQVALVAGYANQSFADWMQPNFGYAGVTASWTLFAWGKRKHTVCERDNLVAMATLKLQQTQDEVRQKALKAFREIHETQQTLVLAQEMARLRKEAEQGAREPAARFAAAKASGEAQVDLVKADLAYRMAYVKLMALISKPGH